MTKPMNNLLKVLEIESEEQQIKALYELGYTEYFAKRKCGDGFKYECRTGSLADLMFRLRGECDDVKFMEGQKAVYLAYHYEEKHWETFGKTTTYAEAQAWFGTKEAKPIHWVIASLIAIKKAFERIGCYAK